MEKERMEKSKGTRSDEKKIRAFLIEPFDYLDKDKNYITFEELEAGMKEQAKKIEAQEGNNIIRNEVEFSSTLITKEININSLFEEYRENFADKKLVKEVIQPYTSFRKIQSDGDCFYSCFIFRLFEYISLYQKEDLFNKVNQKILESKNITKRNGYEPNIFEEFYKTFSDEFNNCYYSPKVIEYLENLFQDKEKMKNMIFFIKTCIAAYLKENKALFEGFVNGNFDKFIIEEVEPLGRKTDNIEIFACTNFFDIGVKIQFLLQDNINIIKIPEEINDNEIFIYVLFTPGHYDLLYPKSNL